MVVREQSFKGRRKRGSERRERERLKTHNHQGRIRTVITLHSESVSPFYDLTHVRDGGNKEP